jgi:hypothetical protein
MRMSVAATRSAEPISSRASMLIRTPGLAFEFIVGLVGAADDDNPFWIGAADENCVPLPSPKSSYQRLPVTRLRGCCSPSIP